VVISNLLWCCRKAGSGAVVPELAMTWAKAASASASDGIVGTLDSRPRVRRMRGPSWAGVLMAPVPELLQVIRGRPSCESSLTQVCVDEVSEVSEKTS
jgi:hypothetical protein